MVSCRKNKRGRFYFSIISWQKNRNVPFYSKSVTLIELIIAIVLVSVIILGINSIDSFSRYQVISSSRRAKLQNDLSYCLDHITKNASLAIGNETGAPNSVVKITGNSLAIFIDANRDGLKGAVSLNDDRWIKYTFSPANKQLTYCGYCSNFSCNPCEAVEGEEALSNKITVFNPSKDFVNSGNYITVDITARWDPASSASVSPDNPEINMRATIALPSVSTH